MRWIKCNFRDDKKLPEELLTEEDVTKLIEAAQHPRDKALVFLLYESGCRIGELLNVKIKNVLFDRFRRSAPS